MASEDQHYRRMQVKVLYSFDNNPTVFLSRSKTQFSIKIAQIPIAVDEDAEDILTLGAIDLKNCIQQVVKSSPENFKLQSEDYAVYHKDITEQPDEPFVANGTVSALLEDSKPDLIPGRVCQNLSASFLFGDKGSSPSLTLEIRLKFHVIHKKGDAPQAKATDEKKQQAAAPQQSQQMPSRRKRPLASASSAAAAAKATRTKSLPIFYHPPNQQISNIINADKLNAAPKYDSKSILERFNSAPFLLAKIIDKPTRKRRRSNVPLTPTVQPLSTLNHPQRAIRTRSMISNFQPMVSSPINEDVLSEATDDTDYNDNERVNEDEEEEEDEEDFALQGESSSPYTPQQPPYKPSLKLAERALSTIVNTDNCHQFQALPDLEDLDSRKTHTISSAKLPPDHDLMCFNKNCAASESVTWRYFETKFHPNYLNIQSAKHFDKKMYDGMFGPLCNACYLFLRNKGFMRPEAVVKKYLQQQKYKKEIKMKDLTQLNQQTSYSSPFFSATPQDHKFATPSHVPSAINEVIKNQATFAGRNPHHNANIQSASHTPNAADSCQDLNDFMTQLNNFGGPLTDIDLPGDFSQGNHMQGSTPPMIATKSNTRVINVERVSEDKENVPPSAMTDFEQMLSKSFNERSSPDRNESNEWSQFFGEPTPKDNNSTTPNTLIQAGACDDSLLQVKSSKLHMLPPNRDLSVAHTMPSSPPLINLAEKATSMLDGSSPLQKAKRVDTTMSYVNGNRSSPQSELYHDDGKVSLETA